MVRETTIYFGTKRRREKVGQVFSKGKKESRDPVPWKGACKEKKKVPGKEKEVMGERDNFPQGKTTGGRSDGAKSAEEGSTE